MTARPRYVQDAKVIIVMQGIRWVKRTDQTFGGGVKTEYQLEVDYKPRSLLVRYATEEERDAMFNKVSAALAPSGPPSVEPVGNVKYPSMFAPVPGDIVSHPATVLQTISKVCDFIQGHASDFPTDAWPDFAYAVDHLRQGLAEIEKATK